jgi:DeoR family transcriptional regulator, aga operon transcriptional repressor
MSNSVAERHQYILNKLHEQGYVNVADLSIELSVSVVTIRKDLNLLEERQLLFRTHGSATPVNPFVSNRPVDEKEKIRTIQKQRIAVKAASFIEPGKNIMLASGSTILELARQMLTFSVDELMVVSASANVSTLLNNAKGIDVWQLGGLMRKSSASVVGSLTERMLENFSCNILFLGVDGIDAEFGLTTTDVQEANLNQRMMKVAQKVVVLADSSKFGKRGFARISALEQVDVIITDDEIQDGVRRQIEALGVELIIAS